MPRPFSLRRPRGVLALNLALLLSLLLPAALGWLAPLARALERQMAAQPLPKAWFALFLLLGALLPLVLRLLRRRQPVVGQVLTPYLLLLAGQITTEVAVVLAGGKGLGVLVGWVFTVVRLLQLAQLWPLARPLGWLRALLVLELALWGLNGLQMLANRWLPLLA